MKRYSKVLLDEHLIDIAISHGETNAEINFEYGCQLSRMHPMIEKPEKLRKKPRSIHKVKDIDFDKESIKSELDVDIMELSRNFDRYELKALSILASVRSAFSKLFYFENEKETFDYLIYIMAREPLLAKLSDIGCGEDIFVFEYVVNCIPEIISTGITHADLYIYDHIIKDAEIDVIDDIEHDYEFLNRRRERIIRFEEYMQTCNYNKFIVRKYINEQTIRATKKHYGIFSDIDAMYYIVNFIEPKRLYLSEIEKICYLHYKLKYDVTELLKENNVTLVDISVYNDIFYENC